MRIFRLSCIMVIVALASLFAMGAGSVTVFSGMIRTIKGSEMVLILKNGSEKQVRLNKDTRVLIGNERSPSSFIKPNSKVEVAVNSEGKCVQVVVYEVPK